jgi:hypothetical protein
VLVMVTDNGIPPLSSTNEIVLSVREVNTAPRIVQTGATIDEGTTLESALTGVDTDIPANALTFRLERGPSGMTVSPNGLLRWATSESNGPSTAEALVVVTDSGTPSLSTTNTFTVTVREVNQAPVLAAVSAQTLNEESPLVLQLSGSDADLPANTLTYGLASGPAGMSVGADGRLAWTPTEAQGPSTNEVRVFVRDSGTPALSTTNGFTVVVREVNQAPAFTAVPQQSVNEMTELRLQLAATDGDLPANGLVYSVVRAPAGFVVAPTGLATWTPGEADGPGTSRVTVRVEDGGNPPLTATNEFLVAVREVNRAPVLAVSDQVLDEGTTLAFRLAGSDPDVPANGLTYSLLEGPTGLTVAANGDLRWVTTEANGPSVNAVRVRVADNGNPSLSTTNGFTVTVREVNQAPVLAAVSNQALNEGSQLVVQLNGSDADLPANTLTYGVASGPAGMSVGADGRLTWTPTEAQGPSTNVVQVFVRDSGSPSLSTTNGFTVVVREVNQAPSLAAVSNQTLNEGSQLVVQLNGSDADLPANTLTYGVASGPAGMSVGADGRLTWTPTEAQGPSTNVVQVFVRDSGSPSLSTTNGFTVVVREVNQAPVFAAVAPQSVDELATLSLQLVAIDGDLPANALSFRLVSGPAGLGVSTSGLLRWTPAEDQGPGSPAVVAEVSDSEGGTARIEIPVTVREVNVAPTLASVSDQVVPDGAALRVVLEGRDLDQPAQVLNYRVDQGPSGLTVTDRGVVQWRPQSTQKPSTNTVRVSVGDGVVFAQRSFVVVAEKFSAPFTFNGRAIDGYVANATLWLDANLNGVLDAGEPSTVTDRSGNFQLAFELGDFDRNRDGALGPDEGRIIAQGGFDVSTGEPRTSPLSAPPGSTVISPLTTLVETVARQNPGLGFAAAEERVRTALELPAGVEVTRFDPIQAAAAGDERAVTMQAAAAVVSDTIAQVSRVLDEAGSLDARGAAAVVTDALARQVSSGAAVDLTTDSAVRDTVNAAAANSGTTLSTEIREVVSQVVAEQNGAKVEAAETATDPRSAIEDIAQVQTVSQGETADALGELAGGRLGADEVTLRFTGEALEQAVLDAPVGDITGTNVQTGTFELLRTEAVVTEDGRSLEPLTVVRRNGSAGRVDIRVLLSGPAGLLRTNEAVLRFDDGNLQQSLDFAGLLVDDTLPQDLRQIAVQLALSPGSAAGAAIGSPSVGTAGVVDNDSAGSIGFAQSRFQVGEGTDPAVEVVRVGGTAGRILGALRLSGGTATAGSDYEASTVAVEFGPGVTRRLIRLPLVDDSAIETNETVNLVLALSTGTATGLALTPGASESVVEIVDNDVPSGPTRLAVVLLPGGRVRVDVFGPAGQVHVVERTPDLTVPWTPVLGIGSVTTSGPGVPVSFELSVTGVDSVLLRVRRP